MKKYLFLLLISIVIFSCKLNTEKYYRGKIIDKGYDAPTSGYRSHTDPVYFIIFYDEECKRNIRVHTTVQTYYSKKVGDYISFSLNENDLHWYGNTNVPEHFK